MPSATTTPLTVAADPRRVRRLAIALAVMAGLVTPTVAVIAPFGSARPAASAAVRLRADRPATRAGIVDEARRWVGRARYVYGGTRPRTGFDCSGYTSWVFAATHVADLPHSAQRQRAVTRPIPRTAARRGDLVFYLSGGSVFHVAIYAGRGMQYSAATPQDGIRYQHIWSRDVVFGTVFR